MYLGRVRQGEWIRILQPKTSNHELVTAYPTPDVPDWTGASEFVEGVNNPTVTVIDKEGNKVVENKRMHLLDDRVSSSLFVVDLYVGSDIPTGVCTARTEYISTWYKYALLPATESNWSRKRTYAELSTFEVTPSGSEKGSYLSSFMYERPQATFLLGQHDDGALDFRRNPRE